MGFIDRITRFCGGSRVLAWLLTANVGIALVMWLAGAIITMSGGNSEVLSRVWALSSDPGTFITHPWTLMTYMAVHFSPLHLLFNMLWLYWFGRIMDDVSGEFTLLWVYIGAGIAGGICYLVFAFLSGYPVGAYLTGASAAVLGVMTYTAFIMPKRRVSLFLFGDVQMRWLAAGCILLTFAGSYGGGMAPTAAHAGGVVFSTVLFYLNRKPKFKTGKPMRFHKRRERFGAVPPTRINTKATVKAMESCVPEKERLDELLDKIRVSGYESLTQREKSELDYISSRL